MSLKNKKYILYDDTVHTHEYIICKLPQYKLQETIFVLTLPCTLLSVLFYFFLINDNWNTLSSFQDPLLDIYYIWKTALDNITDVVFIGHLLNLSVFWSCIAKLDNHVNSAFGKESRYNFVHHPHFADEETETQRVKILLR